MDKSRTAHFGDPCIFCGVGHDDIEPGPCPANDGKIHVAHYASLGVRQDGVEHYRYRTTDGKVHEVYSHVSNRLPYWRSEEHTSELQSLMRIQYAVFCLIIQQHKTL